MKTNFKRLSLAAAVAAATAWSGMASAQIVEPEPEPGPGGLFDGSDAKVSSRARGDLAIIPYYTVQEQFATAIHIMNTTDKTQVVKLRARRGRDSMDSLDFNLVLSPKDVWVGSMSDDDGKIVITTKDTSCTAPAGTPNGNGGVDFVMPDQDSIDTLIDFRTGAEEGYVEIIGMGETIDEAQPIAIAAKHVNGVPRDCGAVRSNFFRVEGAGDPGYVVGTNPVKGVHAPWLTAQTCATEVGCSNVPASGLDVNFYKGTQFDALKVSWAVTDGQAGLEFGSNAVHIEGFSNSAMMTNQQVIVEGATDRLGYLWPDLDGGPPVITIGDNPDAGKFGKYDRIIRDILGVSSVQNDWSSRDGGTFAVATDWVVTMPGQYLMVDPRLTGGYIDSLRDPNDPRYQPCDPDECDWRDIPVGLDITYYNREEGSFTPEEGGLVVSPAINITPDGIVLPYEVNVINWQVDADDILRSQYAVSFRPDFEDDRGWADLGVTPTLRQTQRVWQWNPVGDIPVGFPVQVVNEAVPLIGFAVWERQFDATPQANYGRAIDHSYGSALMLPSEPVL